MKSLPRHTLSVSIVGVVAVTAYAALAAMQILVWNPLAAAPGLSLDEVRAELSGAGEHLGNTGVLVFLGVGVALAVATAGVSIATKAPAIVPGLAFLTILTFGAPAYFVASFGPGMALADGLGISGADHSPWALPLFGVSALAAIAVIVRGVMAARRSAPGEVA